MSFSPSQARMAAFADDDGVVHRDAERVSNVDDQIHRLDAVWLNLAPCRVAAHKCAADEAWAEWISYVLEQEERSVTRDKPNGDLY